MLRTLKTGLVLALLDSAVSFLGPHPHLALPDTGATRAFLCSSPGSGHLQLAGQSIVQLRAVVAAASKPAAKPRGYWHDFANVEAEIRQFLHIHEPDSGEMPSTSKLRKNGLSSLADAISRFGGVQDVAGRLSLACGKPKGYWQDYANTRKEMEDFLALWRSTQEDPNTVPTQLMIRKAGRQDLISAMQLHGGMQRLAVDLDLTFFTMRRRGSGSVSGVANGRHKIFQGRLWSFIAVNGTNGYMPSTQVLANFGCTKLAEDVERLGGAVRVAKRFGLKAQRCPNGLELLEESLMRFVATSGQPGVMPSPDVLMAAGREDLEAKIEVIGRPRMCKYLGLYMDEYSKLQAACDTEEALSSASFVELAVKSERPDLKRGERRASFVRTAPLFRGDTGAGCRKEECSPQASARRSLKAPMRTASMNDQSGHRDAAMVPRSFEEMKERFRQRRLTSQTAPVPSSKVEELESLFRKVGV